jgi:hypothetical protein
MTGFQNLVSLRSQTGINERVIHPSVRNMIIVYVYTVKEWTRIIAMNISNGVGYLYGCLGSIAMWW